MSNNGYESPRAKARLGGLSTFERIPSLTRILVIAAIGALAVLAANIAMADPASPLAVTKTDSADPVASGTQLTYTITTVNTGGAKVNNVILSDQVNHLAGIGVPPQLVLTSSKGSCSQSFFQTFYLVSCSAGSLAGGESWTVTVRGVVTAPNGTTINNTASVTATKSAQNFTTSASATTLVQNAPPSPLADLTINKAGPSNVAVSSPLLYTLTVNNIGAVNATDIKVVDTLPAGVALVSASGNSLFVCSPAGFTLPPVTVTCTGGRVNAGSNATIIINATSPAAPGTITNTAVVDPNQTIPESDDLNNTSAAVGTTVTSAPAPPALAITKTDSPDPVTPGGTITYTIVVTNTGSGSQSRADDVLVVDGTQGLEAASITATAFVNGTPGNCTVNAPQVTCEPPDPNNWLQGGEVMTVTITGTVVASAGTTLINTASVTGNIKNQGVSNTATAITEVKPAVDLSITKADSPDPVCSRSWPLSPFGGPPYPPIPPLLTPPVCLGGLTYTLVVGNSGISSAPGVVVRDELAEGLVFDSYQDTSSAGFVCALDPTDPKPNVVKCDAGTVGPGATATIKLLAVAPPATGAIDDKAEVDPYNAIFEADETNNVVHQGTQVGTGIDLVIRKHDEPEDPPGAPNVTEGFDPIATSGTQTYTIFVDNVGTQDATNIRVHDYLPANTTFLSAEGDHGFVCSYVEESPLASHYVECEQGAILGTASEFYPPFGLPVDDFATIKIKIFAQPTVTPLSMPMHNEVKVDPLHEIEEANELNNGEFENTIVGTGDATIGAFNELNITKAQTSPAGDVATSSIVIYTITVTNTGTNPAVNVKVRDFLPAGFEYIEATDTAPGPAAFFCTQSGSAATGIVVDCAGATLDGTLDLLPLPAMRTMTIKAFSSAVPGFYTNQALVDPDDEIAEGNETNNSASATTKVVVGAGYIDLRVSKTGSPDSVVPGGVLTYTLTVSNAGTNPAFNVTVRDVLPAGVTFVSAEDTTLPPALPSGDFICSEAGGVVSCTGATLDGSLNLVDVPPDPSDTHPPSRTIVIKVLAPTDIESLVTNKGNISINITNQAFIDPGNAIPESNEANNSASESTQIKSKINLTIDKTGPDTTQQSEEEDYVIKVKNEPPTPGDPTTGLTAFGVEVHDALPVGLIPLNVTTGEGNNFICQVLQNPVNVVDCVGDLNSGQEVTITIHIFMTLESGSFDNEACVDPDDDIEEFNEVDNCKTKTTVVAPGGTPENEALNPGSCSDGIDNDGDGLVDAADPGCTPPAPDLSINKSADANPVTLGQTLTYTLNVSNVGGASAPTPVTVTDTLPAEVAFVNHSATNGFTCVEASGTVTCTDPGSGLAVGGNTLITIQVTVDGDRVEDGAGAGSCTDGIDNQGVDDPTPPLADGADAADPDCTGPFTNTATVSTATGEINTGNNSDSVTTSIGAADVELVLASFTDFPDPVTPGQTLEYTIIAVNAGTATATGVEVLIEDVEPAGVDFVGAAGSNAFACAFSDPDVTCTGNLPPGGSTVITVQALILSAPPFSLSSTATVDPANAFTEADELNNSLTQPTTVTTSICSACIDLVMGNILSTPDPVAPGGTLTYIVTAGNAGDISTLSVGPGMALIRIALDPDLSLVSATAEFDSDALNDCELNIILTFFLGQPIIDCTGDLAAGQGVVITIDATVGATEDGGGAGSCADNMDNGGDGPIDGADPDCILFTSAEIDPFDAFFPEGTGATDEFTNANNGPVFEATVVDTP